MSYAVSDHRAQSFWDRIAPKYARKPIADVPAYERKLARVASLLRPSDRVLELGCGTGSTALRLAETAQHVTATDVSGRMNEIAQAKLGPDAVQNVTFRQAGAEELTKEAPFDAVCAFSLLHLVNDVPTTLARVHDQLRPGGLFISKTVCLREGNVLIRALVSVLCAVGYVPRVPFLSVEDHLAQLRTAGFEIQQVEHFGSGRMNPFIVARRVAI